MKGNFPDMVLKQYHGVSLAHKVGWWQLYEQPQLMESVWKAALPTLSAVLGSLRDL